MEVEAKLVGVEFPQVMGPAGVVLAQLAWFPGPPPMGSAWSLGQHCREGVDSRLLHVMTDAGKRPERRNATSV